MEKTQYFTTENIGKKAADILNELRGKVQIHEDTLNIDKSALFILDMQEFFFNKNSHAYMPSGKAIINGIAKFSKIFDNKNRPIIVTKHINTNENAKMMDYWWRDILTIDSGFSNLIDEIVKIPNTELFIKSQYDAFFGTDLHEFLQQNNVEQIIISGVITHLCCETTARSAFVNGYNVFFPVDGTATYNQDIHMASLQTLAHGFANVTTFNILNDQILR